MADGKDRDEETAPETEEEKPSDDDACDEAPADTDDAEAAGSDGADDAEGGAEAEQEPVADSPAPEPSSRRKGATVEEADDRGLADRIGDGIMWAIALAGVGFVIWTLALGSP